MAQAAGRLGDKAHVPSDGHGCPACAHSCVGPAVAGSPNVKTNSRPSLRVGDPGVHSSCCGPNTWKAAKGAPTVFINGKAAYRKDDPSAHCGGNGKLIEGSGNVFIGNFQGSGKPVKPVGTFEGGFVCLDEDGKPLVGWDYVIYRESGEEHRGTTDEKGRTALIFTDKPEKLECELLGMPCHD